MLKIRTDRCRFTVSFLRTPAKQTPEPSTWWILLLSFFLSLIHPCHSQSSTVLHILWSYDLWSFGKWTSAKRLLLWALRSPCTVTIWLNYASSKFSFFLTCLLTYLLTQIFCLDELYFHLLHKFVTKYNIINAKNAIGVRARGQPPDSGKTIIFQAKAKFFGQKPAAKMKNIFFDLLNEKRNSFLSSEIKCPKSGIFTNNFWVEWVRQSNFAS